MSISIQISCDALALQQAHIGTPPTNLYMKIRKEQPGDRDAIRAINEASFPTPLEAQIVDALRDAGRLTISLVAEEQDRVVGHIAFSPVTVGSADVGLGLGPVAVSPEFRRRGIAARLIREGLVECKGAGFGLVVVVGEPEYYGRFGFVPALGHQLRDEFEAGEAFQVMELTPGVLDNLSGLVCYAPEFREADG